MLYSEGDYGPKGEARTPKFTRVVHLLQRMVAPENECTNPLYFTSEAQMWLMDKGYIILQLQGKAIGEIVSGGLPIGYDYRPRVDCVSKQTAVRTQVAINVSNPFLQFTEKTLPEEQTARIKVHNQYLNSQIAGIKAVVGSVADYVEIIDQLRRDFKTILFGKEHGYKYTATSSVMPNGLPIILGCNSEVYGPCFETLMPDETRSDLAVAPILVPAYPNTVPIF